MATVVGKGHVQKKLFRVDALLFCAHALLFVGMHYYYVSTDLFSHLQYGVVPTVGGQACENMVEVGDMNVQC